MSLVRGLIFEMTEEFDGLLDDEITTVTLTYTDDLIVPEIADREGIHILERAGNQLVLEYSCSVKEVKDYLSSYGLPRHPERISFEVSIHDNYLAIYDLPLDTDLSSLPHYPSVVISKEEFD